MKTVARRPARLLPCGLGLRRRAPVIKVIFAIGGAALITLAPPRAASAQQPDSTAARRVLIERAQQARQRDDHAQALQLAEAAGRIEMTPSLRLFMLIEQFALRQYVAALGTAELCVREAGQRPLANRDEIINHCRSYQTRLRAEVGMLTVRVPVAPSGLRVTVRGAELSPVFYGLPVPVDPGEVQLEAAAEGHRPLARSFTITAGAAHAEELTLERLPEAPPPPAPPVVPLPAPPAPSALPVVEPNPVRGDPSPAPRRSFTARVGAGPLVLAGGAALFGALAGVFYGLRQSALDGCEVEAERIVCGTEPQRSSAQGAYTWNTLANVSLGLTGASVLAAGIWMTVRLAGGAPSRTDAPPRAAVTPQLVPGGAGLSLAVRLP